DEAYILDVIRERLVSPALKKKILAARDRWKPSQILIEAKGSGPSLIQDLRREGCITKAIDAVADKKARLSACSARIEAGCVFVPKVARWLDDFRNELMAFPNGKHDDQVDALSQLLNLKSAIWRYSAEAIG